MADIANSNLYDLPEGIPELRGALVVLVRTEWNNVIVDELETGAKRILMKYGLSVQSCMVPGVVEITFAINNFKHPSGPPAAFIALGCVIRGDTPHFDYVCQSVTQGITSLNLSLQVPTIMGILTVENEMQANERIGGVHGHKGEEAAITAIKMILLNQQMKKAELK